MKIWLRIGKANLTHVRTISGISLIHDELCLVFNRMGIECFDEYPTGNAFTAVAHTPDNVEEYIEMWYGDPSLWEMAHGTKGKGPIGYTPCGKGDIPNITKEQLNKCAVVFVACTDTKLDCVTQLKVPVHVLAGGYLPELFYYVERDFDTDPFIFLHAGATQWRKGSKPTCQAFQSAFPDESDVQLLIMSPGETEMFLELREQYSDDPRIVFRINAISDRELMLDEYYAKYHCLVFPSISEGWGRCLTEAMASGMPCIVTRCSAMLEQFEEGCGWWVQTWIADHGFPEPLKMDLADKMRIAYDNRSLCKEKGIFAAKHALKNLTWEKGITKVLPILEKLDESVLSSGA